MKTIIRTRFEDAQELATRLLSMQRDAVQIEIGEPKSDKYPVIYVMGPDGTQFSAATLQRRKSCPTAVACIKSFWRHSR